MKFSKTSIFIHYNAILSDKMNIFATSLFKLGQYPAQNEKWRRDKVW